MILSHLAYAPIGLAAGGLVQPLGILFMEELGNYAGTLRAFSHVAPPDTQISHEHDIPGIGRIPCHRHGICEPITHAMSVGFRNFPDEMDQLVVRAIDTQKLALMLRLHTAASAYRHSITLDVQRRATAAAKRLDQAIGPAFDQALGHSD
jgi:hypothetical protein